MTQSKDMQEGVGRPGGLSSDDGAASVSTLRASIPDAEQAKLAEFLRVEGGEIAHDMGHHVGDQIFEVLKRNGMAQRSEAGATAMMAIAAGMVLEQAIDQCSRAAEGDCREAVVRLFRDLLCDETRDALDDLGIDFSDIPEVTDFSGAEVGKYSAQAIEARRAETGTGSVGDESAVAASDAPETTLTKDQSHDG